jgi:hypothetical protein
MSNISEVKFGRRAASDLSKELRELADAVDRGEITSLVAAFVENEGYSFMFSASLSDAIVLTTLLQNRNVERMIRYD